MSRQSGFLFTVVFVPGVYAGLAYYAAENGAAWEFTPDKSLAFAALVAAPLATAGVVKWWDIWKRPAPRLGAPWSAATPGEFAGRVCTVHGLLVLGIVAILMMSGDGRERFHDDLSGEKRAAVAVMLKEKEDLQAGIARLDADLAPKPAPRSFGPPNPFAPAVQADPDFDISKQIARAEEKTRLSEAREELNQKLHRVTAKIQQEGFTPEFARDDLNRSRLLDKRRATEAKLGVALAEQEQQKGKPKPGPFDGPALTADERREAYRNQPQQLAETLREIEAELAEDTPEQAAERHPSPNLLLILTGIVTVSALSIPRRKGFDSGTPIGTGASA